MNINTKQSTIDSLINAVDNFSYKVRWVNTSGLNYDRLKDDIVQLEAIIGKFKDENSISSIENAL